MIYIFASFRVASKGIEIQPTKEGRVWTLAELITVRSANPPSKSNDLGVALFMSLLAVASLCAICYGTQNQYFSATQTYVLQIDNTWTQGSKKNENGGRGLKVVDPKTNAVLNLDSTQRAFDLVDASLPNHTFTCVVEHYDLFFPPYVKECNLSKHTGDGYVTREVGAISSALTPHRPAWIITLLSLIALAIMLTADYLSLWILGRLRS